MPKIPGRSSTRKTIRLEHAQASGYLMPWEDRVLNKVCCIRGCGHRVAGGCGFGPAGVVFDSRLPGPVPDPFVGHGCPCCMALLLDEEPPDIGCTEPPPF